MLRCDHVPTPPPRNLMPDLQIAAYAVGVVTVVGGMGGVAR